MQTKRSDMNKCSIYTTLIFYTKIVVILVLGAACWDFIRTESSHLIRFIEVFTTLLLSSYWCVLISKIQLLILKYFYDRGDEE